MSAKIMGTALAVVVAAAAAVAGYQISKEERGPAAPAEQVAEAQPAAGEEVAASPSSAAPAVPVAPAAAPSDDPVVARVDGADIRRSEVLVFIQNLPPQMRQVPPQAIFPMALEQVINGKIVDLKVEKTDVGKSPDVAARLEDARKQITRAVYVEGEIEKSLSEAEVKKAYDKMIAEQQKVPEVKARHILVEKEDQAKEIIAKIQGGAKFEDMAKEFSKDDSNKASGGDLGYFAKDTMVKEFAEAAFALGKGEVSKEPVKTQFGYHVIQVEDKRDRPAPKFEDVKPQLEAQLRRDILNTLVEGWREGARVETFDYDGKPVAKAEDPKPAAEEPAAEPAPAEGK